MPDDNKPFEMPDVTGLNAQQLRELESQLLARRDALGADAPLDELRTLVEQLSAVGGAIEEADQRDQLVGQLSARRPSEPVPVETVTDTTATATDAPADTTTDTTASEAPAETAPEAVAASGRPGIGEIASRAPKVTTAPRGEWFRNLVAAAEVGNTPAGSRFGSVQDVADAFTDRAKSIAHGEINRTARVASVVTTPGDDMERIDRNDSEHTQTAKLNAAVQRWQAAVDAAPEKAPQTALTAAGWCAPSQTLYDFCAPESSDGFISLPETSISRGGVRFFRSPDFSQFTPFTWEFTEAQLIVEPPPDKPCPEMACPTPTEVRAMVKGACIQADILTRHAFPELINRYVRGVGVAHDLNVHLNTVTQMVAGSTAVDYTVAANAAAMATNRGFTATLLNTTEWQSEDMRADSMLPFGNTLNVALPRWARALVRADLASRNGVDLLSVTNEQINGYFADRGMRVQWLQGWQTAAGYPGATGAAIGYPASVQAVVWFDGTWVRGLEDVLTINTHYDAALFLNNKYVELFTEQGFLMVNPCLTSRAITIPICANGSTAAQAAIDCGDV